MQIQIKRYSFYELPVLPIAARIGRINMTII